MRLIGFELVVCCLLLGGLVKADTGAEAFAGTMNASGRLYHDRSFRGPEVVFRSSGLASRSMAMAAWLKSRAGHRELIQSGAITEIACVGNVCVGRGASTSVRTVTTVTTSTRKRWFSR